MSNVNVVAGIGFSSVSGAVYLSASAMAAAASRVDKPIVSTVPEDVQKHMPWSPWGSDNLLPKQYIYDIGNTGILNGIVEGKSRFAVCEGIKPVIVHTDKKGMRVIDRFLASGEEPYDFLEMNNHFDHTYEWMRDLTGFSWGAGRFKLNTKGDKIALFQRDDLTEVRLSKKDPTTRRSMHLWYSADWDKVRKPEDNRAFKVPLLNPAQPLYDLEQKAKAGLVDHAFVFGAKGWGNHYYPVPMWMSAYKWIKIAQGVPQMKAALFQNAMRPKMKVIVLDEYWEERYGDEWTEWDANKRDEVMQEFYDHVDRWLVGSENAHKSIFTKGFRADDGKVYSSIIFEEIPDNTKPGELLPDAAGANSEIAFAMLWNNAMTGGNQASGLYESSQGGSNVRESLLMQVLIHEVERQRIRWVMNIVKYFNGWNKTYKGLDFIIPATILTTTDTGGSTKAVNTGGVNSKENADKNPAGSQKRAA